MKSKDGKKGKKKTERIDFSGVEKEVGARGRRIPEGTYIVRITTHKKAKKEGGTSYYFSWKFVIVSDARGGKKQKGVPMYYITSLKPEALFNLRNLIYAASDGKKNVAGKSLDFDPTTLYGAKIGIVVEDEEYDNRIRSKAVDVMPLSQIESEDEDDEDEDDEDDEDEDEDDEDDLDDVDEDDV